MAQRVRITEKRSIYHGDEGEVVPKDHPILQREPKEHLEYWDLFVRFGEAVVAPGFNWNEVEVIEEKIPEWLKKFE